MMKSILITGGCGFIGVNLIKALLNRGDARILVVDNLSVGTRKDLSRVTEFQEIETSDIEDIQRSEVRDQRSESEPTGIKLVVGDIRDSDLAVKVCRGMDAVVHLAANTGVIPSIDEPRADFEANVIGTFNYLEAARQNGAKKFILASSGAPLGEQMPPINEEKVPKPISPYGASKLAGEGYCSAFFGSFGLKTIALRFGNVYGPRSTHKGSVVAKFIKQALAGETLVIYGDGSQTRDFIYIDDLVNAILAAAKADAGGEVFQIATHKETTINEIAEMLKAIIKFKTDNTINLTYAEERAGEVKRNFSDISKARKLLGWEPKWSVEEGLRATVEWFVGG